MMLSAILVLSVLKLKTFSLDININTSGSDLQEKQIFSESSCSTDLDSTARCEQKPKVLSQIKLGRWDPVHVGYVREVELEIGKTHKMVTMAINPPVFVIDDYLEDYECDHLIDLALKSGMFSSQLHIDPETMKAKNYTHRLVGYSSNFENFDLNRDNKLNLPTELQKMAYVINYLYLNEDDIAEIIKTFEITVTIQNNERWISRADFEKINHNGLMEYLKDLRETHPRHRDRYSEQVWLNVHQDENKVLSKMMERLEKITGLHKEIVYGTEPIQVLRYTTYGHYHAHFDSQNQSSFPDFECCHTVVGGTSQNCRICRYMTALVYLNDVPKGGETAFPVADDYEYSHDEFLKRKKGDLYNLSQYCHNGSLVVSPKKGRMVMWYNHLLNEEGLLGILDPYSLHGGCDVIEGEKWIANNWIPAPDTPLLLGKNIYKPQADELKAPLGEALPKEQHVDL